MNYEPWIWAMFYLFSAGNNEVVRRDTDEASRLKASIMSYCRNELGFARLQGNAARICICGFNADKVTKA